MGLIDVNYYSESSQFHSGNWFEKLAPTLIGIVIGFGLNKFYDWYKEKQAIQRAGEEFLNELELFIDPLLLQIDSIKSLVAQIETDFRNPAILKTSLPLDDDRFKSIDRLFVYKYFKKKNNGDVKGSRKIVNRLYRIIKISDQEAVRMESLLEKYTTRSNDEFKRFSDALNSILKAFSEIINEVEKEGKDPNKDEFIVQLNNLFEILKNNTDKGIKDLIPLVCEPMSIVTATFRLDDRQKNISEPLRVCFSCFREQQELNKEYVFKFRKILESFEKQHNELSVMLTQQL